MSATTEEIIAFYRQMRVEVIQKRLELEQALTKVDSILAENKQGKADFTEILDKSKALKRKAEKLL
jgi:hypothetical protein